MYIKKHTGIPPEMFAFWQEIGNKLGFLYIASGLIVISLYKVRELLISNVLKERKEFPSTAFLLIGLGNSFYL